MVFSQDGIFSRAEQGADKYGEVKARETLELALGEAQMQKYEQGLTDEQLTEKINTIGEELPKEKPENPNLQNVIVDGHIFEIDRNVPKIVDYIGPANGVIITAKKIDNGLVNGIATISVTGIIKTYDNSAIITNVKATKNGVVISNTDFNVEIGKTECQYTINNITDDAVIVIEGYDSNEHYGSKNVNIQSFIWDVYDINEIFHYEEDASTVETTWDFDLTEGYDFLTTVTFSREKGYYQPDGIAWSPGAKGLERITNTFTSRKIP